MLLPCSASVCKTLELEGGSGVFDLFGCFEIGEPEHLARWGGLDLAAR